MTTEIDALIARAEQAGEEEQREVLEEAAAFIWGVECRGVIIHDPELFDRLCAFDDMLDAEAYESAAMMLVPEGRGWELRSGWALVWPKTVSGYVYCALEAEATTPAIALVAAILKTHKEITSDR